MDFLGLAFQRPAILWWLAACSIPILLNLLHRQRFKKVQWAAMDFLRKAIQKNQKKIKFENLLLLLLRILIIAALIGALSLPFLTSNSLGPVFGLSSQSNMVIIIDNSYSMGTYHGDKTYFQRAKDLAKKLVDERLVQDQVALMILNEKGQILSAPQVIDETGKTKDNLVDLIGGTELTHHRSDYSRLFVQLNQLVDKFDQNPALNQKNQPLKKIYFLTDNQRLAWKKLGTSSSSDGATGETPVREALADLAKKNVLFNVIDVAEKQGNLAITDFELRNQVARVGLPFQFKLQVKNFGSQDIRRGQIVLEVIKADDEVKNKARANWSDTKVEFNLNAGQKRTIPLPRIVLKRPGVYKAKVQFAKSRARPTDALLTDNVRYLVFEVKSSMKVLLVNGEKGELDEVAFLKIGLNPWILEKKSIPTPYDLDIVDFNLPLKGLEKYGYIVLANVESISLTQAKKLREYVSKGGGLIVFPGSNFAKKSPFRDPQTGQVQLFYKTLTEYNNRLFARGNGPLPVKLEKISNRELGQYANMIPSNYDHPLFETFRNFRDRITAPRFQKYFQVKVASGADVLATFSDATNTPAVVTKKFGQGQVLFLNFTCDRDWTNFPITQAWRMFLKPAAKLVARKEKAAQNFKMSEQVTLAREDRYNITLISPRGENLPDPFEVVDGNQVSNALSPQAISRSGIYDVEWRSGSRISRRSYFSVNLDTVESDLDRFGRGEIAEALPMEVNYTPLKEGENLLQKSARTEKSASNELWKYLFMSVILFMLLEMWLASWFGAKRS